MGFFSDLKEDLSQAVNELIPEEEQIKKGWAEPEPEEPAAEPEVRQDNGTAEPVKHTEQADEVSLEEMLKNIDNIQLPEDMAVSDEAFAFAENTSAEQKEPETSETSEEPGTWEALGAQAEQKAPEAFGTQTEQGEPEAFGAQAEPGHEVVSEETVPVGEIAAHVAEAEAELEAAQNQDMEAMLSRMLEESPATEPEQEKQIEESKGAEETMEITNRVASDETSVITTGMVITGDLITEGSVDVAGTINGNIDALGKLNITGHVTGNSKAAEIYAENAKINGEIISEGAVKIEASTVIIGNISAASAAIAGAVKGDIDVKGPVILDASAIVMGNIKSKSVQINNGAVIEGMCSQCYADVSPTSFFEDYKPEVHTKSRAK